MTDTTIIDEYQATGFSLTDIFNRFAKRTLEDFPQMRGKFSFYSATTNTSHGNLNSKQEEDEILRALKESISTGTGNAHAAFAVKQAGYYLMAWVKNQGRRYTSIDEPLEQEVLSVLEHELGHLIAPGGADNEYVADAFCFIRLQKNKDIGKSIEAHMSITSIALALNGDSEHFTNPVLIALKRLSQDHDFSSLTPTQAANLAYRTTLQYAPSQKQLDDILLAFSDARKEYKTGSFIISLQKFALAMFTDQSEQSEMIFSIGKSLLDPFLNSRHEFLATLMSPEQLKKLNFEGYVWDTIRKGIEDRDALLQEEPHEQTLAHEARDMQVLGYFDRDPDKAIDAAEYEAKKNQDYLKRVQETYIAIRNFQITGEKSPLLPDANTNGLNPEAVALLAKQATEESTPIKKRRFWQPR
jgi:hypothetical protein